MKRILCVVLSVLVLSLLPASEVQLSSFSRISEIMTELEIIQNERENYLNELETINSGNRIELQEKESELQMRLAELNEREKELQELKLHLELFGDLIDDQAVYYRSLQKKLTFWKLTSGILAASLAASIIIQVSR